MLKFNNFPPERAGDVEIGGAGTRHDLKLVGANNHRLFNADSNEGYTLLGMMAGHGVSEPRIESDDIDAKPEDTVKIIKRVVDEVGEIAGDDNAIWFARGVFHALRVDFPEFVELDSTQSHELFQELIGGVSEEAAQAIKQRAEAAA